MIKYITVPTLKFNRGALSDKELDKRVKFASKKQYSAWDNRMIDRDVYTKGAIKTQMLLQEMQKYPYDMLLSFLEDYKGCKHGLNKKYPQGLCDLLMRGKNPVTNYEYALSILPLKYRNVRTV